MNICFIKNVFQHENLIDCWESIPEASWKDRLIHTTTSIPEIFPCIKKIITFFEELLAQCIGQKTSEAAPIRSATEANPSSVSDTPPFSKRALMVEKSSSDNESVKKIGEVARKLQALSSEKQHKSSNESTQIFSDLATISKLIAQCMENPQETRYQGIWDSIFVCQDIALREIQAIALVHHSFSSLTIAHIATHPKNVRCSLANREETTRVEGAGTALIQHLAHYVRTNTALFRSPKIYLESVPSAQLFYEKLGFEALDSIENPPIEYGTIPMELTQEKIGSMTQEIA